MSNCKHWLGIANYIHDGQYLFGEDEHRYISDDIDRHVIGGSDVEYFDYCPRCGVNLGAGYGDELIRETAEAYRDSR